MTTEKPKSPLKADIITAVILGVLTCIATYWLASSVPSKILKFGETPDLYFSADVSRVHDNMVRRLDSNHHRTNVHPLFSILMYPSYHTVALLSGNDPKNNQHSEDAIDAARILSAIAGLLSMTTFFFLVRGIGARLPDAILLCMLALSSAYWIFWYSVPETYPWGSLSILLCLLVLVHIDKIKYPKIAIAITSLGTFAITTTNWSIGILATLTKFKFKKAFLISVAVLAVASGLSVTQKLIFPSSWFFFKIERETSYVSQTHSGGPLHCLKAAVFHSIVAPEFSQIPHTRIEGKTMTQAQLASPGSASIPGRIGVFLWAALAAAGLAAIVMTRKYSPFVLTLLGSLAGQLLLHSVYGAETFLYSAHIGPLMLLIAAYALINQTMRPYARIVCIALVATAAMNNLGQFSELTELIATY